MTKSENFTVGSFKGDLGLNDIHMLSGQYKWAVPLEGRGSRPLPEVRELLESHANPDETDKALILARKASNQDVVGAALLHLIDRLDEDVSKRTARIIEIFTDIRIRGGGSGSELLNVCIDEAVMEGADFVELVHPPLNLAAERLFESRGFVPNEDNALRLDLAVHELDSVQ